MTNWGVKLTTDLLKCYKNIDIAWYPFALLPWIENTKTSTKFKCIYNVHGPFCIISLFVVSALFKGNLLLTCHSGWTWEGRIFGEEKLLILSWDLLWGTRTQEDSTKNWPIEANYLLLVYVQTLNKFWRCSRLRLLVPSISVVFKEFAVMLNLTCFMRAFICREILRAVNRIWKCAITRSTAGNTTKRKI